MNKKQEIKRLSKQIKMHLKKSEDYRDKAYAHLYEVDMIQYKIDVLKNDKSVLN